MAFSDGPPIFDSWMAISPRYNIPESTSEDQGAVIRFALNYPRTNTKVKDLDQVATIAIAALFIVICICGGASKIRKWIRRGTESWVTEEFTCLDTQSKGESDQKDDTEAIVFDSITLHVCT